MEDDLDAPRVNRFKHQSYTQSLKEVHVPSALSQTPLDNDLEDHESHFHTSLEHWQQLNLAPSFIKFAHRAGPLAASMPLLLHNWQDIMQLWLAALDESDDEGLRAVLDLLQKLMHDLRTTLSPVYLDPILPRLLALLQRSKSISAAALTALLATFAAVFKFLLVPASADADLHLLEATWVHIRETLPRCLPEVQRAMAEVWGGVLRRFKSEAKGRALVLLCESIVDQGGGDVQDAVAWCLVYACKSVSQTLHTCTPSILVPLVNYHLIDSSSKPRTYNLLRRLFTALIHHVRNAEAFSPVGDILVEKFITLAQRPPSTENELETLQRMLDLISIPAAVRNGSRLTQKHATTLLSTFPSVFSAFLAFPDPSLCAALLRLATALLTASPEANASFWMGKGREILDVVWTATSETGVLFAISLTGALAELSWAGWRAIGVPLLLRMTSKILMAKTSSEELQRRTVGLVAELWRTKKLGSGDGDVVWRNCIETWGLRGLREMAESASAFSWDQASQLTDILALSPLFSPTSGISPVLVQLCEASLAPSEGAASGPGHAWFVGTCMRALSQRAPGEWESLDLERWVKTCTTVDSLWATSAEILEALASLLGARSTVVIEIEVIYPALAPAVLSHSRALRLGALRLLAATRPSDAREVVKRCLAGEEVPLEVQGVRERVLRIGRLEAVVKDKQREEDVGPAICARWLVAQLKVNLRPLWSPAAGALAQMAERFGDEIWQLVFKELQNLYSAETPSFDGNVSINVEEQPEDDDDPRDEERSWRDPSAHKLRGVVSQRLSAQQNLKKLMKNPGDRLDTQTYESQLLFALGESPALVQKHNRDLVPFFLGLATSDDDDSSHKLPRHKLNAWLTVFSKLSNPKALHSTDALRKLYLTTLSHADRTLQSTALSCILTYKSPGIVSYEAQLRAFLDDTRWRDELSRLDLSQVEPQHREEVVDVIIRLLFGLMLEKKGRSRGADRRAAVLGVFGGCTDAELGLVVDLMLRSLKTNRESRQQQPFMIYPVPAEVSEKQQIGYLGLLGDVIRYLGPKLVSYWPALLGATMDFVAHAQARIAPSHAEEDDAADMDADAEPDNHLDEPASSPARILRSIRQLGLKRLADFFRCKVAFDYTPYMPTAFTAFISPRLASLDRENTQAPSALLELFYVWTHDSGRVMFLTQYDTQLLPKVYDCLVATNVKPAVVSRIFDIVDKLLASAAADVAVSEKVVKPHVSLLLNNLATLVERTKGNAAAVSSPLGQRQISILSSIAQYSTNAAQASTLLKLFIPLLRKPAKVVSEKVKVDLLSIIGALMALIPDLSIPGSEIYLKTYELLSHLFQSLRSRLGRVTLVATFRRLSQLDPSLERVAGLLESLNAYSARRVDEPDFDRRITAFLALNETLFKSLTPAEWLPIIYSMLYAIQDPAELAIRTNSALALRHFIGFVAAQSTPEFEAMFARVLFPGIKNGLHSKNELVRAELLGVLAYAIDKCDSISALQDMRVLLAGGDEEANFFNNIHHIQIHRRSRALRRLADQCDEGHLRSSTLAEILIPLVGNYITTTSSIDHHLVNDAILATGRMAKHLAWGAYYALVQKYLRLSKAKDASERVYIRTLVALLDNFHFPMEQAIPVVEDAEQADDEDAEGNEHEPVPTNPVLQSSARIADAVNLRLLPSLLNHLEKRDDTTDDSTRIPIAIGIVKVAMHLPSAAREPQITRLLTALSQVFRSRSQETRDLTRETLARIAVSLGPSYLALILRELRAALLRGPHLHVLAYVTHSLLVHVSSDEHSEVFGNLDDCANDVAYVSAEVIFGESAKDVMAEEFKTKMREVRSSSAKGLDSFGIVARYITPSRTSSLLVPLRAIMQETGSLKVMQLVEEVLKRITNGLNANKHLVPTELLVLCHTLISQNAKFLQQVPPKRKGKEKGDAIVQVKRQLAEQTDHYANNSFRFVTFGLDLFSTALRRSRFDFHDPETIRRLESMVVVIGNTLYSSSSHVLMFGLKAAAGIIKCPLKNLDKSLPVYVQQTIDIVKQAGNTESEMVQVAFKSLATMLRDGPAVQVKEKDLVYLLELLTPDLEEPTRQASVFAILRAIVARKFVVPEIYQVMDKVAEIMVTSQSPPVQELCRSVLLQFLLDYPQGKGRLRNQMTFLAKNLSYEFESGRKSVLELLSAVLTKFDTALIREYVDLLFVALVMVIANDDSAKCREMSAQLIKTLFTRLDDERQRVLLSHLHSWASQTSQPQLARVASQVYGYFIDVMEAATLDYVPGILDDLHASLARSSQQLAAVETSEGDSMDVDLDWQVSYHSLVVLSKILRVFPHLVTNPDMVKWDLVVVHLLFPHAWVRTASCRLIGVLFAAVPPAAPQDLVQSSPISGAGMRDVATKLSAQLKSEHLDEALSLQIVKNLLYIGKCFYAVGNSASEELETEKNIDEEDVPDAKNLNPLPWLFSKLSYQIRSAHIARRSKSSSRPNWSQQPLAVLRWFAAMAAHMEAGRLEAFLVHILTPVYRLAEDDTIRDPQMDELKALGIELQDLVQTKVGPTKFSAVYNQIRQGVLGVQRERKAARAMQATVDPEAAARRKQQRNVIKKESKKRKSGAFSDGKGRLKRRREE